MNQIYQDIAREETREVLYDMWGTDEMYYGAIMQYMGRYLWKLEDNLPGKDIEIWDMFQGHQMGYMVGVRIRDAAVSVGGAQKEPTAGKGAGRNTPRWNTSDERNCSAMKKETSKESA